MTHFISQTTLAVHTKPQNKTLLLQVFVSSRKHKFVALSPAKVTL